MSLRTKPHANEIFQIFRKKKVSGVWSPNVVGTAIKF